MKIKKINNNHKDNNINNQDNIQNKPDIQIIDKQNQFVEDFKNNFTIFYR